MSPVVKAVLGICPGHVISPWLVVTSSMIKSTIWNKPTCSTYCHVQDEMELVAKKNIGYIGYLVAFDLLMTAATGIHKYIQIVPTFVLLLCLVIGN